MVKTGYRAFIPACLHEGSSILCCTHDSCYAYRQSPNNTILTFKYFTLCAGQPVCIFKLGSSAKCKETTV